MNMNWQNSSLWKLVEKKEDEGSYDVKIFLQNTLVMPKIEKILQSGGTSPQTFTLHDHEHSFRVAERIYEIIPETTRNILSSYDICLLLLSSYIHDIGMTPELKKIQDHYLYLTSYNKKNLTSEEISEFQKWLDNESVHINIQTQIIEDVIQSQELLTYYCRYKHNDWSEEWVLKNLKSIELPNYLRWQNDLINICKSHHYGLSFLEQDIFDPKIVNNTIVNRRYIAICLRVGDVLEIDPERTPSIILKHRNINEKSLPFWIKDQETSININKGVISFYARPQQAFLHKAIEETIFQIQSEIHLCNQLNERKPYNYINPRLNVDYKWDLKLQNIDVKPFEDSYVYIKGSFRPNVYKILELLGGEALYGDIFASIRELVQNCFDSIKERVAYKRLYGGFKEGFWQYRLEEEHKIIITFFEEDNSTWLSCKDNGVGMTKEIIENYLLVSGSSQRHEISELARRCLISGIEFEKTGQFGIGVLSYFLIAETIIIKTKRAQDTGYHEKELQGWQFKINGLQDFGELSKINLETAGTEVLFKLKKEIFLNSKFAWEKTIEYLKKIIVKSPCTIELIHQSDNTNTIEIKHGWTRDVYNETSKAILTNGIYEELKPEQRIVDFFESIKPISSYTEPDLKRNHDIRDRLKIEFLEGDLPDNLGNFRICLPYFSLETGDSVCYADLSPKSDDTYQFDNTTGDGIYSNFPLKSYSWKGFQIEIEPSHVYPMLTELAYDSLHYEINLNKINSILSVNRSRIKINNEDLNKIHDYINQITSKFLSKIKTQLKEGIWELYNDAATKNQIQYKDYKKLYWFFLSKEINKIDFKPINYPIGIWGNFNYEKNYILNEKNVNINTFGVYNFDEMSIDKINKSMPKLRILNKLQSENKHQFCLILESCFDCDYTLNFQHYRKVTSPKNLTPLFSITEWIYRNDTYNIVNIPVMELCHLNDTDQDEFDLLIKNKSIQNSELKQIIESSVKYSFIFIFQLISRGLSEYWNQLVNEHSVFLYNVWRNIYPEINEIYSIDFNYDAVNINIINLTKWEYITDIKNISNYFEIIDGDEIVYEK